MSKHIETKHKLKEIKRKSSFYELLEDAMISEVELKMMIMYYIENRSLSFIADELGYSEQGIAKMHKRILNKIEDLL